MSLPERIFMETNAASDAFECFHAFEMSKNQIRASKYLSWSLYLTMPEYSLVSIVRNVYYICLCEASSSSRIRQPDPRAYWE